MKNDLRQIEWFFNGMSDHANQATQRQPSFENRHDRVFKANGDVLTKGNKQVEDNERQANE